MPSSSRFLTLLLLFWSCLKSTWAQDPSSRPSISIPPTTTPLPTKTAYPTRSERPSSQPSHSQAPSESHHPTLSHAPSLQPTTTLRPSSTYQPSHTDFPSQGGNHTSLIPTTRPTMKRNNTIPTFAPVSTIVTDFPSTSPTSSAVPSAMPVSLSSDAPSDVPTFVRVSDRPSSSPLSITESPSHRPSDMPTGTPLAQSAAPTHSHQPHSSDAPSAVPTVTFKPSEVPSTSPSAVSSNQPSQVTSTVKPTLEGKPVSTNVSSISIAFVGATMMTETDRRAWQRITATWFDSYFEARERRFRRQLQATGVRNMTSSVEILSQMDNSQGASVVTYNQQLNYVADSNAQSPEDYVTLPFMNSVANRLYGELLINNISSSFSGLQLPVAVPTTPSPTPTPQQNKADSGGLSTGAIIGIAVGGAAFMLLAGGLAYSMMGGHKGHDGYVEPGQQPPSQFNFSQVDEVSTMEDPTVMEKVHSHDPSLGEFGDQSVATVDYDYSKAYGGGGEASVSSAGGTLGDTTRLTTGDLAAAAAGRAALGASTEGGQFRSTVKEEVIEVVAPAGKLGVVIDTPDDGAPVVHAVKDSSVIADQIQVGDKLVAVDDEDVRSMTAIKVSKLISKKSANPSRKLTLIRTSLIEDPEG